MKRFLYLPITAFFLIVAIVSLCCPVTARANTIALSFAGAEVGVLVPDFTYGWAFTLSGAVLVTDLGLWDEGSDGLQYEHTITIWDNTTMAVMAQATVKNTGTTLVDGFRYVSLASSVLLLPGDYTIGGYNPPPDFSPEYLRQNAATITTASGVTYNGSRSAPGNFFPAGDIFDNPNSYFGPNFQFTPVRSVPDAGSALMLLAFSAVAIFGLNLLQRKLS
jgi:hypothetical protein